MVARNQFVVWSWVRIIRRSFVHFMMTRKETDVSDKVTSRDLYHKFHVAGPASVEILNVFSSVMHVLVGDKLQKCTCQLDISKLIFAYRLNDGEPLVEFPLFSLKSLCVSLDCPPCEEFLLRFDLLSAKIVLSHATRESSFNDKSNFEQLKHGMTVIPSFNTHVLVNFLDGRELVSIPVAGISPFWDTSTTIGVSAQSFSEDFSCSNDKSPAAVHVHILTGGKGSEKVLGSKIILYSDLFDAGTVSSLLYNNLQRNSKSHKSDLKSTYVTLDMNIGLELEILGGEILNPSLKSPLAGEQDHHKITFSSYIEVCCIRHVTI